MVEREFPAHPLVGVGAVVFDDAGRVLLIKRGKPPGKGRWSLPGGLLELGETLKAAAEREVFEETGLKVHAETVVDVVDRIYRYSGQEANDPRVQYHYVVVDYWCRLGAEATQRAEKAASDALDLAWVARDEWRESRLYSLDELIVQVIEKARLMALEA